ncbi:uncharacterized protein [Rutidosis leptorrhynchoides]|uniref:uncharacterized protein n=1 Tax=Rutidosis leptorrhynchoides TaxID=125765 RepID=UPI003A99554F
MRAMGFGCKCLKWIEACFRSASISVLINGSPTKEFNLQRGIRQGDPLFPYLFIITSEGLNILANIAVRDKIIRGVEIGRDKCTVWKNIIKVGAELSKIGVNFDSLFEKQIGDGHDVLFWSDLWASDTPLRLLCPRLYRLENHQAALVFDRVRVSSNGWSFIWDWSREISGRLHGELDTLMSTIKTRVILGSGRSTRKFKGVKSGLYTTKSMVSLIDEKLIPREASPMVTLRNNLIPQKVGIFMWRIQRKRIAVKEELDRRGIDLDSLLCPLCNDVVESVDHAIYSCKLAQEIWVGIHKWWDLPLPSGSNLEDLIKGGLSIGLNTSQRKSWQAIVWVTCYYIWKNRNQKIFRNEA